MEEKILVRADKISFINSLGMFFLVLFVFTVFVCVVVLTIGNINSMYDFLMVSVFSLAIVILFLFTCKIIKSYISDDLYLTNKKFVLKRGNKIINYPLENIIKLRCANNSIFSVISIRTKDVKKHLIFFIENSTEFYNEYLQARKNLNLPPEHDKENPNALILMMIVLSLVIGMDVFQDYLENVPAPDFATQEVD